MYPNSSYPPVLDSSRLPVGTTVTGEPFGLDYRGNLLLVGETGSGKSVVLQSLIAGAAQQSDLQLVLMDPFRGGSLGRAWKPRASMVADDIASAASQLNAMRLLVADRLVGDHLGDEVIVIVEDANIFEQVRHIPDGVPMTRQLLEAQKENHASRQALDAMRFIAAWGGHVGVYLYASMQRADSDHGQAFAAFGRVLLMGRRAQNVPISTTLRLPAPTLRECAPGRGVLHVRGQGFDIFDAHYIDSERTVEIAQRFAGYRTPLV